MARLPQTPGYLLAMASLVACLATPAHAADPKAAPGVLQQPVLSQQPIAPSGPPQKPAAPTRSPQFPVVLPDPKTSTGQPLQWSPDEIAAAKAQCEAVLAGHDRVAIPREPLREGECGAPYPMELISVGKSPQVTLSQPAMVTCDMVAALSRWFRESVQPAAKRHLGSPVIRIQVMSSYSCRNAYGRKKSRLSEHGRANALDVRGFLTERNTTVELAANWGLTARDIRAQLAAAEAAKREAEKRAAELKAAQARKPIKDGEKPGEPPVAGAPELRGPIAEGAPPVGLPKLPDFGIGRRDQPNAFGLTPPSKLGGPKPVPAPLPRLATDAGPAYQAFLRQIHAEACKYFGTVLGPESNEAHRDHFHIDMAPRATGNFCE